MIADPKKAGQNSITRRVVTALWPLMPFFFGLGVALVAAVLAPSIGAKGGPLHTDQLTDWAVALIFLIQGLQLPADQVRRGFSAWKVHCFCQGWMFIVFPLLGVAFVSLFGGRLGAAQRIGILYLSMLPTTVASNAAFSARAGGNTATALFNIVFANTMGVFIAPAWLAWLLTRGSGAAVNPWPLMLTIVEQLIVPFVIGQLLRLKLAEWAARKHRLLRDAGSLLIFFIVYSAVCNLFAGNANALHQAGIGASVMVTLSLLVLNKFACWKILGVTGWTHDLRVAAFYSATQKTLAAGLPIAKAVYDAIGNTASDALPPLALLMLPVIVFHIGQLIIGALLIPIIARGAPEA